MTKYYFDGVIVVEGTSDSAFLSSFIDSLFVETNGYQLPKQEIEFLKALPKEKKIIVLTDSDEAGKQIRNKLNNQLNGVINVSVDINLCNKNNKHGVAECDKNEIINILKEYLTKEQRNCQQLTTNDIIGLGINTKNKREYLCSKLNLGICNNKTMIKRMNLLKISKDDIKNTMEGYHGN